MTIKNSTMSQYIEDMMIKETNRHTEKLKEEEFQLRKIILEQIFMGKGAEGTEGKFCWMSWGAENVDNLMQTENQRGGISFTVSGFKHKGIVQIALTWMDEYKLRFPQADGKELIEVDHILAPNLCLALDQQIEYGKVEPDEYREKVVAFFNGEK